MRCTPRQGGSGEGVNLGNVDRGLEVGGLFVTFERLAVAFEPIIDGSLADIGVREGIVQREGMVIAGEGFVQATELFESGGFFYMGFGMVTVESENFLEANEGAAGLLQIEEGFSRIQQDARRWLILSAEGNADGGITTGRTRRWMDRKAARTYSITTTRLAPRRMPVAIAILS